MKSSLRSDEIFGVPPQMKSNPLPYSREAGFHHEVISPTAGGFLPPEADLTEKALAFASAFSWHGVRDSNPRPTGS